ncbi:tetratricopeptide repeat protein [Nonomuraea sp. NPDC050547]|uniref:tetratricopeptide repeat protein n=1 Tax=Nonomuraea sp. NPDC050547 TaxID=3364368 RepID=UPI0037A53E3E
MDCRVLGPVVALGGDGQVELSSGKAIELLAVLVLAEQHRASHETIARYLWPGEASNGNRIRQCFYVLRQHLPDAAHRKERGFCQLQFRPKDIDYGRFKKFLHAAQMAENPSHRLQALKSAYAEWRGTPLEGLPGPAFQEKRDELIAELHDLVAACVSAELDCGQPLPALNRAHLAIDRWPESLTLLDLKVKALRVLGRLDEIEPALSSWEQRSGKSAFHLLLSRNVATLNSSTSTPQAVPDRPRPRQLPPLPVEMVGRGRELEQLEATLLGRTPGRSRIAMLAGPPGVGKSSLASWAAALIEQRFLGGILHVDLGGFSSREPERHGPILARFLNDVGVRPETPTMDGMVSAYRSALADQAILVILDNALDEDHARLLLPGPGASAAIVTSRRRMHGLAIREGAELIDLAPMTSQDSIELLRTRMGDERMRTVVPFLDDIVHSCAGIPLALAIMAARIASRPAQAVGGIVRELRQEGTTLRSLNAGTGSESVRRSIENSHKHLTAPAGALFWQLAVHPGPTISWPALRALVGNPGQASGTLDELMAMSLVTEPVFERYAMHDLVRAYAAERADTKNEGERSTVMERVLSFLLHNAWSCDRKLDPGRRLPIGEPRAVEVVAPAGAADAMAWLEAEYSTLTAAIRLACRHGLDHYTWLLAMTLVTYQWRTGRGLDAIEHLTNALAAAERVASSRDVAMVHRMRAGTHRSLGNLRLAIQELRNAVRLSDDGEDIRGGAMGRHILGVVLRESGVPGEALEHFGTALSVFTQLEDLLNQGAALNGIGSANYDLGRFGEALDCCRRSLDLLNTTDDLNGQAHALFSLGRIHVALGDHESAIASFEGAVSLYRSLTYASREARTLVWLSEALRIGERPQQADGALDQALTIMRRLGKRDPEASLERLRSLL